MRARTMTGVFGVVITALIGTSSLWAGQVKRTELPEIPLTEVGHRLEAEYSAQLEKLQAEIRQALPKLDQQQADLFLNAYQSEAVAASAELAAMRAMHKAKDKEAVKIAHVAAKDAMGQAATNALAPSRAILQQLEAFLSSDKLDDSLARVVVISEAAPRGLAEFAQQGKKQKTLVKKLLADSGLMKQMLIGGGARDGKYGQAMQIYTEIQKASKKAKDGVLQKLALGISLELAVPVQLRNAKAETEAPSTVDPVKRYLHYEKAFLDGELDPGFKDLSVWDHRMVVNGNEPDKTLAWGREMLRNYRPDEVSTSDYRWRYVKAVKTEVKYGSKDQKDDRPDLQFYQNIIMNGGICGRRAFFGRFILRSFGVPTVARPQRGHATLAHWTPDGWVINLGAGWGWGWMSYGQDRDFLAHTQARMAGNPFIEVLRAQWVGAVLGEPTAFGFHAEPSGLWNGVALYRQRAIIEEAKAVTLAAVGTDIGEANESKEKDVVEEVLITDADKTIAVADDGSMTIPAVACITSTNSPGKILFMESNLGGKQLHYNRNGKPLDFEYTFDASKAGAYALSARIVTTSANQILLVAANDAKEPTSIEVPFTIGMWDRTTPVEVALVKGKNVLYFSRGGENIKGLTIRDFTLTPLK